MQVKPDWVDRFTELVTPFTGATRAEPGGMWFEWSRSLDDPEEFVLVEAFRDDDKAGAAHVGSEHFQGRGGDVSATARRHPEDHQPIDSAGRLGHARRDDGLTWATVDALTGFAKPPMWFAKPPMWRCHAVNRLSTNAGPTAWNVRSQWTSTPILNSTSGPMTITWTGLVTFAT